ncbi:MAG: restriction endonuclease subunit S [Pseudomonadota bacterium]|nr:restriction endonuclease subunit S [Pseudomonadota bacterium]
MQTAREFFTPVDIKWLKRVPKHWPIKRLRFVLDTNPVKSAVADLSPDTMVSFLPMEAVTEDGRIDLSRDKTLEDVYNGYTYFRDNDVLIAKITPCFENGKGALATGLTNGIGFGTTEFHVLRADKTADAQWLYYLSKSSPFREIGASEMLGAGGQKRISDEFIKDFRLGIPPLAEQTQIARFLDYKTAQLDQLIEKKQALIERLNEQRIALITQAVTRGLNPDVPLKDSGVEWLGQVPEGWEVKRLRFVIRSNPLKSEIRGLSDSDIVSFVPMDAVGEYGGIELSQQKTLEQVYTGYTYFKENDVVVAKITPCFENGKGALARNLTNQVAFGTTELHVLRAEYEINPEWLFYLTISYPFREIGASEMYGAGGQKRIPEDFIKDFRLGIPDYKEQTEIVSYLDFELDKLDTLKDKTLNTITRLEEYRTALITAAVTGKIDVRDVQIPVTSEHSPMSEAP